MYDMKKRKRQKTDQSCLFCFFADVFLNSGSGRIADDGRLETQHGGLGGGVNYPLCHRGWQTYKSSYKFSGDPECYNAVLPNYL